jgi:hypothetical protein
MRFMMISDDLQEEAGQAAVADGAAGAERKIDGTTGPGGGPPIVNDDGDGATAVQIGDPRARAER